MGSLRSMELEARSGGLEVGGFNVTLGTKLLHSLSGLTLINYSLGLALLAPILYAASTTGALQASTERFLRGFVRGTEASPRIVTDSPGWRKHVTPFLENSQVLQKQRRKWKTKSFVRGKKAA